MHEVDCAIADFKLLVLQNISPSTQHRSFILGQKKTDGKGIHLVLR